MTATAMRHLIVNADDFGQSAGINEGIIECFEHGVVTSTSLMVRWPGAPEAAAYGRAHPELSIGLHIDLGEWRSVGDGWDPIYEVVPIDDEIAIRNEVARQMAMFEDLMGNPPSHLDTHQHVHLREPMGTAVRNAAKSLGVPLRHESKTIRYCGDFYGLSWDGHDAPDEISVHGLLKIVDRMHAPVTELACHPGRPDTLDTMYRKGRQLEILTLTDPRLPEELGRRSVRLCSFLSLPKNLETAG